MAALRGPPPCGPCGGAQIPRILLTTHKDNVEGGRVGGGLGGACVLDFFPRRAALAKNTSLRKLPRPLTSEVAARPTRPCNVAVHETHHDAHPLVRSRPVHESHRDAHHLVRPRPRRRSVAGRLHLDELRRRRRLRLHGDRRRLRRPPRRLLQVRRVRRRREPDARPRARRHLRVLAGRREQLVPPARLRVFPRRRARGRRRARAGRLPGRLGLRGRPHVPGAHVLQERPLRRRRVRRRRRRRRRGFRRRPASRGRGGFREIWGRNTTRNHHRHAW